jgi:hypothetical protein
MSKPPYRPPHHAGDKFMEVIGFLAATVGGFRLGPCCAKSAVVCLIVTALILAKLL